MSEFILSAFGDEIAPELSKQMDTLSKCQISYIEARGVNGVNVSSLTTEQAKEAKNELDARGFKISSLGSPIGKYNIEDDFSPHFELYKHTLEICGILNTKNIRMFSFFVPSGDRKPYSDAVLERLNKFVTLSKEYGITLLHENELDIYGESPEDTKFLLDSINNKYFRLAYDPSNFVQAGYDAYDAYKLLDSYIDYVHIKDSVFETKKVVPAGYGEGKIEQVLTALKSRGYKGFLSLEPHLGTFEGLSSIEKHLNLNEMPKSGADTFIIAYNALKTILDKI